MQSDKELKQANEIIRKAATFSPKRGRDASPQVMVDFIDDYKKNYGIEPICRVLPIAPLTYYRAKDLSNNPENRSQRQRHDDFYISEIRRIWHDSKCRYGVRKVRQSG